MTTVQIQFTIDDRSLGRALTAQLLERRSIACAQEVGPIRSTYWWEGEVATDEEWLYLCKTGADCVRSVIEQVVAAHPYDTPEVIALPVEAGHADYLDWVASTTAHT